jgi:molecular chaperone GrpE
MSEKVEVEIQGEDDQDQSAEEVKKEVGSENETAAEEKDEAPAADNPEARAQAAEQKCDEYYDRLLRASAEFDNYKKRTTREMRDVVRYANEKLFKELINVVDNLERAIASAEQDGKADDPLLQGVRLTLNEVEKILERHNVEPIAALGEAFDPNFHQAMMQEESADHAANTVISEMQKGYKLHDRLLRPAMVVVSKAKSEES